MKAKLSLFVCLFVLVLCPIHTTFADASLSPNPSTSSSPDQAILTVVASIPVGEKISHVKTVFNREGSTGQGPESFTVSNDGTIYLLDSLQNRVLVIQNGTVNRIIYLSNTFYPQDILFAKNRLYILDSNLSIFEVTIDGQTTKIYSVPEALKGRYIHKLAEEKGEIVIWTEDYFVFPIEKHENQFVNLDFLKNSGVQDEEGRKFRGKWIDFKHGMISSIDHSVEIPIETEQVFGSATIVGFDRQSNIYVLVEEIADPAPTIITEVTLRKYNKKGQMIGVSKFPLFEMLPHKPVEITKNGDVYFLIITHQAATIYKVQLGKNYISSLPFLRQKYLRQFKENKEEKNVRILATYIGNPYSRATTRSRAYQMADFTWTWNNNFDYLPDGTYRPNDATKPSQLQNVSNGSTLKGIPYHWGGWDSLWSRSDGSPWTDFSSALTYWSKNGKKGPLIGDVYTSKSFSYIGGKGAGIDCSGFVSAAAGVFSFSSSKPGTGDIFSNSVNVSNTVGNNSSFISYSGMQPMDMFVLPGTHVLFYDYRAYDGTGIYTIESTTDIGTIGGNMQGAKRFFRKWSNLSNYTLKSWWTRQPGDDFANAFTSFASGSIIKGQTVYYKYVYSGNASGSKNVLINSSYGDPDLFVYSSNYSLISKSTQSGTSEWTSFAVSPGSTYYIAVHGFSDTSYTISLY